MSATSELYNLSATDVVKLLKEGLVRLAAACSDHCNMCSGRDLFPCRSHPCS